MIWLEISFIVWKVFEYPIAKIWSISNALLQKEKKREILLDKPITVLPQTQQDEVNSAVHFCVNSHKSLMGERRG